MSVIFTFNGPLKTIELDTTSSFDVSFLYSRWKDWVISGTNSKYAQAFSYVGGEPTVGGKSLGITYFLINNWKIQPYSEDHRLQINGNLFTEDGSSAFIPTSGSYNVLIESSVSNLTDAQILLNEQQQLLEYNGIIIINSTTGTPGTDYPYGTSSQPVDNIENAKIIANKYGIYKFEIYGPVYINSSLENFTIIGGNLGDTVIINNISVDKTTFRQCLLSGSYNGYIAADNCIIHDGFTGMNGYFQQCGFMGDMYFNPSSSCVLNDCHSQIAGNESPSLYLNDEVNISLRKYSGGLKIYNTGNNTLGTLEFNAGNCRILEGNMGGTLVIRGLATLTNNSEGTEILTDGLITPNQKVFGGQIG
jgi:hypothetical protein